MSYYYKNKVYDYYQVTDTSQGSQSLKKDEIEIINNEKILFDFTSMFVYSKKLNVLNYEDVETIKIHIDWGDGQIDRLSKPLVSNKSSIGAYRPNQWKLVEHLFNVKKRYEYKETDADYHHKIVITAYNTFNDKLVITIPYKMMYKTLYDLGSTFSLFSANTTNTNKVSYTLKQNNTDSLIVGMSRDYKDNFNNDDEVEVLEKTVSEIFSDEFVNEDLMTWDWKSVPTIQMSVPSKTSSWPIQCKFKETGISIDDWEGDVVYINDFKNKKIKTTKVEASENDEYQFIFKTDAAAAHPNGLYAFSVNPIIGINGVVGKSETKYIQYNTNNKPREIKQYNNVTPILVDNTNNKIVITYTLKDGQQLKNLTKVDFIFTAKYQDANLANETLDDIQFSFDVLSPQFSKNGIPLYIQGKTEENYDDDRKFVYEIYMRDIPNTASYYNETTKKYETKKIKYNVSLLSNDVLGGDDNTTFLNSSNSAYTLPTITFDNYSIGRFEGTLSAPTVDQVSKEVSLTWKFKKADDWDEFVVKWTNTKDDGHGNVKDILIRNDVHEHLEGNVFNDLTTSTANGITTFVKKLDGNKIPDGKTTIDVDYNVHMNHYYDVRNVNQQIIVNDFQYPKPQITHDDVRVYTVVNYNALRNKQTLSLALNSVSNYNTEPLKNTALLIKTKQGNSFSESQKINIPSLNHSYVLQPITATSNNLQVSKNTFKFAFTAANKNDIYDRMAVTADKTFEITQNISNLVSLPSNSVDYLSDDNTQMFTLTNADQSVEVKDWLWVKQNTLHDVNKTYSFKNGTLFGSDDCDKFTYNGATRYALYEIVKLHNGVEEFRRFKPYTGSTSSITGKTELKTADNVLKVTSANNVFQEIVDKSRLSIRWENETNSGVNLFNNLSKIKDMWFNLYDSNNTLIRHIDVKGLQSLQIDELNYGNYSYEFVINSEYTKTANNTTTKRNVRLFVPNDQSVIYTSSNPTLTDAGNNKKYINWVWAVNHKSAVDIKFRYRIGTDAPQTFDFVKDQPFYQSMPIEKGKTVEYYFLVKSENLQNQTNLEDGYVIVNKKSITIE